MENFKIGDKVQCKAFGPLKYDFKGIIEKVYEHSALISFTEFNLEDKISVSDLHNQAVVHLTKIKKIKK